LPFRKNIAVCNSCGHKWHSLQKIRSISKSKTSGDDEEWVCAECGAVVTEDATVCSKCGADVSDVEED
jgi:DNA-directed RNA polymerase subunit RPC12/RpoP